MSSNRRFSLHHYPEGTHMCRRLDLHQKVREMTSNCMHHAGISCKGVCPMNQGDTLFRDEGTDWELQVSVLISPETQQNCSLKAMLRIQQNWFQGGVAHGKGYIGMAWACDGKGFRKMVVKNVMIWNLQAKISETWPWKFGKNIYHSQGLGSLWND